MRIDINHYHHPDDVTKNMIRLLFTEITKLRKEFKEYMDPLNQKVFAIQEAVNTNFTTLSDTITEGFTTLQGKVTEEVAQVRSMLEQNNDVQGALSRLGHLEDSLNTSFQRTRDAIAEGFDSARSSISSIVPEEQDEEGTTPADESPEQPERITDEESVS